jgi:magnesium chelatase family protein
LPPFTLQESLETTKIHSVAGRIGSLKSLMTCRPFRSPHCTISSAAMAGGGGTPQPGEVSLSHNGVLFLDELPEFQRSVLEVMRQPLEDRKIDISRARYAVSYPAGFMLVASMNPCPCGYYNHPEKECVCPPGMVRKYLNRISGPLLDRIDIHIEVVPVSFDKLSEKRNPEISSRVRERVSAARLVQEKRFCRNPGVYCNAQMSPKMLHEHCPVDRTGELLLKNAMQKLGLSARAYDRILKLSRTIADLDTAGNIKSIHLAEAIQYLSLDRDAWAG